MGVITAPDGRAYSVAVMIRETRQPIGLRMALMQKVSRAVVDYWRAHPQGEPAQTLAAGAARARTS